MAFVTFGKNPQVLFPLRGEAGRPAAGPRSPGCSAGRGRQLAHTAGRQRCSLRRRPRAAVVPAPLPVHSSLRPQPPGSAWDSSSGASGHNQIIQTIIIPSVSLSSLPPTRPLMTQCHIQVVTRSLDVMYQCNLEARSCQEDFNRTFHLLMARTVEKPLTTQSYAPTPAKNAISLEERGTGCPPDISAFTRVRLQLQSSSSWAALNARSLEDSVQSLCVHLI